MALGLLLLLLLLSVILLVPMLMFLIPIISMFILMLLILPITSSRSTRISLVVPWALTVVVTVSKLHLLFLSPIDDGVEGNLARANSSSTASS